MYQLLKERQWKRKKSAVTFLSWMSCCDHVLGPVLIVLPALSLLLSCDWDGPGCKTPYENFIAILIIIFILWEQVFVFRKFKMTQTVPLCNYFVERIWAQIFRSWLTWKQQSKKIRNINTVGVTFINVSAIGFAMCSLVCLEAKKKKKSFQLLLFKNVSVLKKKRQKVKI